MALIAKAGHQCNLSRLQVLSKQFLSFADPYCFQVTIRRDTFRFCKQPQQGIFVHTSHSCQFFQRHFFCIMPQQSIQNTLLGHYTEKVTLEELAAVACMNKYSLLRLFTKTEGITPYRYLETIRIGKAKELLAQDLEPAEVALMTGFSDQSHFSKFFKEVIGVIPRQYRNIFKVKQ